MFRLFFSAATAAIPVIPPMPDGLYPFWLPYFLVIEFVGKYDYTVRAIDSEPNLFDVFAKNFFPFSEESASEVLRRRTGLKLPDGNLSI
mmetsp:Transcript_162/g.197  ORF Transcript_162/g.197 Transcript_162/m.197 type:complete len:89 (-) Transcript_162:1174-1440(-)